MSAGREVPSEADLEQMPQGDLLKLWKSIPRGTPRKERIIWYMTAGTLRRIVQEEG
jgi:hypothetical protein